VILACIANIVLRAFFIAQCVPYHYYENQFNNQGNFSPSDNNNNGNNFNNSIWCGNKWFVYIVNGIIILLALPAMIIALSLLGRRKPVVNNNSQTIKTTETRTVVTA